MIGVHPKIKIQEIIATGTDGDIASTTFTITAQLLSINGVAITPVGFTPIDVKVGDDLSIVGDGFLSLLLPSISFGLFFGGALISWKIFDHIQARVSVWNDPWEFRSGSGYQLVEAALAMANGGLTGTGLGNGEPNRIPEVETDFIFAAIGEEMGLLGTVLILSSFLIIIGSG